MKKLVAKEFEVKAGVEPVAQPIGLKYTYLVDPETGKFYRPVNGWTVTGENLSEMFVEVDGQDWG